MNLMKDEEFIFGSVVLLISVTLIISVLFGVIEKQTDLASGYTGVTAKTAAASFHISNTGGEFGSANKSMLEQEIDGDDCTIDRPGFRPGGTFHIVTGNVTKFQENDCVPLLELVLSESFDGDENPDVEAGDAYETLKAFIGGSQAIVKTPIYYPKTGETFYIYITSISE